MHTPLCVSKGLSEYARDMASVWGLDILNVGLGECVRGMMSVQVCVPPHHPSGCRAGGGAKQQPLIKASLSLINTLQLAQN